MNNTKVNKNKKLKKSKYDLFIKEVLYASKEKEIFHGDLDELAKKFK